MGLGSVMDRAKQPNPERRVLSLWLLQFSELQICTVEAVAKSLRVYLELTLAKAMRDGASAKVLRKEKYVFVFEPQN